MFSSRPVISQGAKNRIVPAQEEARLSIPLALLPSTHESRQASANCDIAEHVDHRHTSRQALNHRDRPPSLTNQFGEKSAKREQASYRQESTEHALPVRCKFRFLAGSIVHSHHIRFVNHQEPYRLDHGRPRNKPATSGVEDCSDQVANASSGLVPISRQRTCFVLDHRILRQQQSRRHQQQLQSAAHPDTGNLRVEPSFPVRLPCRCVACISTGCHGRCLHPGFLHP